MAQSQGNKWQKMLYNERRQRIQLVEMVDQIAREQTALEHVANNDKEGKIINSIFSLYKNILHYCRKEIVLNIITDL